MWEAQSTCRPHRWAPALGSLGPGGGGGASGIGGRCRSIPNGTVETPGSTAGCRHRSMLAPAGGCSPCPCCPCCGAAVASSALQHSRCATYSRPTGAASPGAMLRDTSRAEPLTPCPAAPARAGPARRVWLAPRGLALQELPAGQRPSAPLDTQRGGRAGHQLGQEQQRQQQRGGRRRRQQCRRQLRSCGGGQLQAMRVAGARTSPAAVPALVQIDVCRCPLLDIRRA